MSESSSINISRPQSLVVYKDISNVYLYGEKEQLKKLITNSPTDSFTLDFFITSNTWGPCIKFSSIASVYTFLLRNEFKLMHESKAHYSNESSYFIEVWYRNN